MDKLLLFYLVNIIISLWIKIAGKFVIYKSAADLGYLINIKKYLELRKQLITKSHLKTTLIFLVPIINVLSDIKHMFQYTDNEEEIFKILNDLNILEKMSYCDKIKYQKNNTVLKSFLMSLSKTVKLANATVLEINDDNNIGKIYYKVDKITKKINIIKATGSVANLSNSELKNEIINSWNLMVDLGVKEYGNKDNFVKEISKNNIITVVKDDIQNEKNNSTESNIRDEITYLKNIREDFINNYKLFNSNDLENVKIVNLRR